MFELPKEYEAIYEHIRLASPDLKDYKVYAKHADHPVTQEQFIDVATFITGVMMPARLNLTEEERDLIANHHIMTKLKELFDALSE